MEGKVSSSFPPQSLTGGAWKRIWLRKWQQGPLGKGPRTKRAAMLMAWGREAVWVPLLTPSVVAGDGLDPRPGVQIS